MGKVLCVAVLALAITQGCVTARSKFAWAERVNTASSYRSFIEDHPTHALAAEARSRVEQIEYAAAVKADSISAYESYLKTHGSSARAADVRQRLSDARERDLLKSMATMIKGGDYPRLVEAHEQAKSKGYPAAEAMARRELERWKVSTVAASGLEIASVTLKEELLKAADAVVRVDCAATTSRSEKFPDVLGRNPVAQAIKPSGSMLGISRNVWDYVSPDALRSRYRDGVLLYLFPLRDADRVVFQEGSLELRDRVGGTKFVTYREGGRFSVQCESGDGDGDVVATLKTLQRATKEDKVFSLRQRSKDEKGLTGCAVVLIVELPVTQHLASLQGRGFVWSLNTAKSTLSSIQVSSRKLGVLISGEARLPEGSWVSLRKGLAVKGGTIRFEETRVLLSEGTHIALRRP